MKKARIKPLYNPVGLEVLRDASRQINQPDYQALFNCCYLFGLRITEALGLLPENVSVRDYESNRVFVAEVATLKNRHYPLRYPVAWERGLEGTMANEFIAYANNTDPQEYIFRGLTRQKAHYHFNKARIKMGAITWKPREYTVVERGIFPHYLRHCRASHLVNWYNFDELKLMIYMGWSDPKLAAAYVKSDWTALAKKGIDIWKEI
jgi:integrase